MNEFLKLLTIDHVELIINLEQISLAYKKGIECYLVMTNGVAYPISSETYDKIVKELA